MTISIHDAKTNLSKYIADAKRGKKVYIGGFGKAEVVLTKISDAESKRMSKRTFAIAKGKVIAKPGAFSAATDQSIALSMLGE